VFYVNCDYSNTRGEKSGGGKNDREWTDVDSPMLNYEQMRDLLKDSNFNSAAFPHVKFELFNFTGA